MIKKAIVGVCVVIGAITMTGSAAGAHTTSLRHCINKVADGDSFHHHCNFFDFDRNGGHHR